MIRPIWQSSVRTAARPGLLLVVALFATLATLAWPASIESSSQRVLSVTAYPTAIPASDGVSKVTVRIPAAAAGDESQVNLSTDRGAFTGASGPTEINAPLFDVGNNTLGTEVKLVADGRTGDSVVIARVGSLVDKVTIRFVGEPAALRVEQPAEQARLRASDQHIIKVVASDETGFRPIQEQFFWPLSAALALSLMWAAAALRRSAREIVPEAADG